MRPAPLPLAASIALLLAAALLPPACNRLKRSLYSPKVNVQCKVLKLACRFENFGDPGEACVELRVFHSPSGRTLTSQPVCSGPIERGRARWVPVVFPDVSLLPFCMGEDLRQTFEDNCRVEIVEIPTPDPAEGA